MVEKGVFPRFAANASDFGEKLVEQLLEFKEDPVKYHEHWIGRMHKFSINQLTHVGLARAMAYALTAYGTKQEWTPKLDDDFSKVNVADYTYPSLPPSCLSRLKTFHST